MSGAKTVEFDVGGLYEYPLEKEDFDWKVVKGRAVLVLHNKLINQFNTVDVTFIVKDFWGKEFSLELNKKVTHKGNDDIVVFGQDFTHAIFKNSKLTSIWLKLEFNKPALYIFVQKLPKFGYSRGGVF